MGISSERQAFPRRWNALAQGDGLLGRPETEKGREGLWHSEERDARSASPRGSGITGEALGKREPIMRPLRARKGRR